MRSYLNDKGYLEVETPILQPIYGGAADLIPYEVENVRIRYYANNNAAVTIGNHDFVFNTELKMI